MTDILFEQLSTVQSNVQQSPPTIPSAATISPLTLLTFISGTVAISTITPPVTGAHILILIFTNSAPGGLLTTGNIKSAITPTTTIPIICVYDPVTAQYWCGTLKTS